MLRLSLAFALLLLFPALNIAQPTARDTTPADEHMYRVNPWISGGIALVGLYTNATGLERLRDAPLIPDDRLDRLKDDDLIGFDKPGLRQDPSKEKTNRAQEISDLTLYTGAISPILLFLDKRVRDEWLDVSLMYLETQAATSNFYTWGPLGPTFAERLRPAAYYTELPYEERRSGNNRNSLYSGHVASTATGWFYCAKVYSDYHPELGAKKFILYGIATVPVVISAVNRVRALRHFPSDTVIGGILGGAIGVLIPTIHKRTRGRMSVGAIYNSDVKGLAFGWRW